MIKVFYKKSFSSLIALATILTAAGCHKKVTSAPPLPPAVEDTTSQAPTAKLTATPTVVAAGEQVILNWRTSNAEEVSIEGIGVVPSAGTKSVRPSASTTFRLIAKNGDRFTEDVVRVTVNTPPPSAAETTIGGTDDNSADDQVFHQQVQDIFFDYDTYQLPEDGKDAIARSAGYLNAHPTVRVVIGGYCDERGSSEYNLALGENRANSARKALIAAGISATRVRVISYGKEKQFCSEHTEQCWQQNRRAGFNLDK